MSRVVCRLALSDGAWETRPSRRPLWEAVRRTASARLVRLQFEEPGEDEILVAEATMRSSRYCHAEIVRDDIVEALLASFRPEYESMVEVEVIE